MPLGRLGGGGRGKRSLLKLGCWDSNLQSVSFEPWGFSTWPFRHVSFLCPVFVTVSDVSLTACFPTFE